MSVAATNWPLPHRDSMRAASSAPVTIIVVDRVILPDPVPATGLISWPRAVAELSDAPDTTRQTLFASYHLEAQNHCSDPIAQRHLAANTTSGEAGAVAAAMLGAAAAGALPVFVRRSGDGHAHEVDRHVWRGGASLVVSAWAMALAGRFLPVAALFPADSLECQLAGADLYIRRRDFSRLIIKPAGSIASRRALAQRIVAKAEEEGRRVLLADFIREMRAEFPAASGAMLRATWREAAPAEWRRGGRPRR